ncbi:peptide ABC transporter substrate-binding protein [Alicyclobacillus tolerans]|uniref:Peptide/nickel transport system substrate-binding protein n=1 Tax=Alicyclobacillus tolerans TaxID=90970 RepID=A0A1M6M0G0_9BACL|nr:peptide ABC transporter substrate-binding protein [Alicyclobacillus montanus]SHJ76982.1 peptide/nickel transport system substrate-binding protein [Alicyclobacillus montanus]
MGNHSMRKISSMVFIGLGLCMAVTGCASQTPSKGTAGQTVNGTVHPTPGGTIIFAEPPQANLNWFFPLFNIQDDGVDNAQLINMLYKPLLWINNQFEIDWNSSIASKITYNRQGTVYHVFMNSKWHWSNGHPVTSKDILFSWHVIQAASAANAPSPWPYVGAGTGDIPNGIKSLKANGPYEFTVTLDHPANQQWFIYNGLIQLTPLPASAWDKYQNIQKEIKYLGDEATHPMFDTVVDGPFQLVSAVPNQSWTIVPNPRYSGHKSIVNKIIFQYEASNTAEFSGLRTGSINVGYLDPSQYGSRQALLSKGEVITPQYAFGYFETQLNMFPGSPVRRLFDKLYIRQALQMGIDNESIDQAVYHGFAPPLDGPIPQIPHTAFFDSQLSQNPYPYNPQKGKQLLEAHGWKLVNGIMTKGAQKLKFTMIYAAGSASEQNQVEIMKQDWAQEGIDVTLKSMPASTQESITYNAKNPGDWEMSNGLAWFYNGPGYYPSGGQLFATNAPSGFGYSNPEEDALIAATHQPYATPEEAMQAFYKYEYFTALHLPVLWDGNVATLAVHAPQVHGTVLYGNALTGFPQMNYWWVSSNAATSS